MKGTYPAWHPAGTLCCEGSCCSRCCRVRGGRGPRAVPPFRYNGTQGGSDTQLAPCLTPTRVTAQAGCLHSPTFTVWGHPGCTSCDGVGWLGKDLAPLHPPGASHPPSALAPPPRGDGLPPARKKGFCSLGNPSSLKWVCFFFRQEAEPRF